MGEFFITNSNTFFFNSPKVGKGSPANKKDPTIKVERSSYLGAKKREEFGTFFTQTKKEKERLWVAWILVSTSNCVCFSILACKFVHFFQTCYVSSALFTQLFFVECFFFKGNFDTIVCHKLFGKYVFPLFLTFVF